MTLQSSMALEQSARKVLKNCKAFRRVRRRSLQQDLSVSRMQYVALQFHMSFSQFWLIYRMCHASSSRT